MRLDNLISKLSERREKLSIEFEKLPVRYWLPNDAEEYAHIKELKGRLNEINRIIEMLEMAKTMGAEE